MVMPSWIWIFGSFLPRYPTLPLRSYVFAGNWDIPDLQNLSISCAIKLWSMTFRPLPKKSRTLIFRGWWIPCALILTALPAWSQKNSFPEPFIILTVTARSMYGPPADLRLSSAITLKNCCFPSVGKMYICWNPPKCPPTSCKTRKISVFWSWSVLLETLNQPFEWEK